MSSAESTSANLSSQLILSHQSWSSAVRMLLLEPGRCAVGPLRWNQSVHGIEWIVDHLIIEDSPPQGADRFPLTDWLVLMVDRSGRSAMEILQQVAPRTSQTVIVVVLGNSRRGAWDGAVHHEGEFLPLKELRVIGPRMLRLSRYADPLELIPQEGRWSRTAGALGSAIWPKIRDSHVLLVGCGRNGTIAAWQLAGLGVHHWTLVDPDLLEAANLDAMTGLAARQIGQTKTTALAHRLLQFNPEMSIRCLASPVTEVMDRLRGRYDLIVSCVDQEAARLGGSWLSRRLLVPHLDLGTSVTRTDDGVTDLNGDARLLLPFEGCVECVGGIHDRTEAYYELAAPPGSLHRGEPVPWYEQRAGSLVHLNSLTVAAGIDLWRSLLGGTQGSAWLRVASNAEAGWRIDHANVSAGNDCPHCRPVRSADTR